MKIKLTAAFVLLIVLFTFLTIPAYAFEGSVTISSSAVNIRSGPGTGYSVVYQASEGETFDVIEQDGQWYKVRIGEKTGWVAGWLVSKNAAPERTAVITANTLNVRSGPDASSNIVAKLAKGDTVKIDGVKTGWYEISAQGGVKGWISSDYASESLSSVIAAETSKVLKAKIAGARVNLRTGPGMDYTVIGSLSRGKEVTLIFKQGDWYQILYNDQPAWVASWLTDFSSDDTGIEGNPYVLIPVKGINLRSAPDINSTIVGKGEEGERFEIIGKSGQWYRIALKNGGSAFVADWVVMPVGVELPVPDYYIGNILEGLTIVVDAGHGGNDPGAIGLYYNTREKDINLSTARILERKLVAAGAKVIMTRSTDKFIPLQQIASISNNSDSDAFVSIHYNMNDSRSLRGSEVYYHSGTANASFARSIYNEIVKRSGIPGLGVKRASFVVLRENNKLSVLVEGAFLSNSKDEALARTQDFQEKIAEGIFQGIAAYFNR